MPLGIVTRSPVTLATCTTSRKMGGTLLVRIHCIPVSSTALIILSFLGNYDISTMHYDGPGDVPGGPGKGYGYDIRVEGRSSANPPTPTPAPAVTA
jgi:hypothetical protein